MTWLTLGLAGWALLHSRRTRAQVVALQAQVQALLQAQPQPAAPATPSSQVEAVPAAAPEPTARSVDLEAANAPPPAPQPEDRSLDPAAPSAPQPQEPQPAAAPINWEQWIGVRGAAVVGGAVLALAGILFFKYSVEHDLVPPAVRVGTGVLTGLACIVAGVRLARQRYGFAAQALVGGGLVVLYAAFWAAHNLYHLIDVAPAFLLLALTTAAGGVLAVRLQARGVAIQGLLGGFMTPLLLQTQSHHPFGLFGYILMLDVGVLLVARRIWPPLALLSLVGTVAYQIAWILFRMQADQLWIGLAVLGGFGALYALASPRRGANSWRHTQMSALLLPLLGALYFASRADMGPHFYPVGGMLLLLDALVVWISRHLAAFADAAPDDAAAPEPPWAPRRAFNSLAAAMNVGVFAVWCERGMRDDAAAWEGLALACGMAAVFCAGELWQRWRPSAGAGAGAPNAFNAARVATCGLFVVACFACIGQSISYWPGVFSGFVFSLLASWLGNRPGQERLQSIAAASLALALGVARWSQVRGLPSWVGEMGGIWLGGALLWSFLAQLRRDPSSRSAAERAVCAFVCVGLGGLMGTESRVLWAPLPAAMLGTLVLAMVGLSAASRAGSGIWGLACAVACAWAQGWTAETGRQFAASGAKFAEGYNITTTTGLCLMSQIATVAVFTLWPFFAGQRAQASRWTWYTAAAAAPLHLVPILLSVNAVTVAADGAVAVLLGGVTLAALRGLQRAPIPAVLRRGAIAWLAAAALGMLSVAIPLQLQDEWLLIGWALEGLAVTELWARLQHPALKYFAGALFGCVVARLVLGADEVYQLHTGGLPLLNWLLYTYGIPAGCLLGAAWRSRASEPAPTPGDLSAPPKPIFAAGCGLAGLAVVFVWINLCIAQAYGAEHTLLSISQGDDNARNLTVSVAWALYALLILAAGVRQVSVGLRWVSLILLMLTVGKVFLSDLGDLEDLYRVASLVGLALSLITVSLCYQRFVFAPLKEKTP